MDHHTFSGQSPLGALGPWRELEIWNPPHCDILHMPFLGGDKSWFWSWQKSGLCHWYHEHMKVENVALACCIEVSAAGGLGHILVLLIKLAAWRRKCRILNVLLSVLLLFVMYKHLSSEDCHAKIILQNYRNKMFSDNFDSCLTDSFSHFLDLRQVFIRCAKVEFLMLMQQDFL